MKDPRPKLREAIRRRFESNGWRGFENHINVAADEAAKLWPRKRTNNQNAYWHGVIVKTLADELGYTIFEMHELLKLHFLPKVVEGLDGVPKVIGGSTTDLSTKEFSEVCEKVRVWALSEFGIAIEPPPSGDEMISKEVEEERKRLGN